MSESASPIVDDEGRRHRGRAIMMIVGLVVAAVSYALWCLIGLLFLSSTEEGLVGVAYRYVGLPAWLIVLSLASVKIVGWMRLPRNRRQRPLAVVLLVLVIGAAVMFVAQPLLDVPYLFNPVVVELHDVEAVEYVGEQRAYHHLRGTDATGRFWVFRINPETYSSWDEGRTTVTVTGLPNTQVTLSID